MSDLNGMLMEMTLNLRETRRRVGELERDGNTNASTGSTYDPDARPGAPSVYDDEFDAVALDAKWTAINCASGTVDLLSVAAAKDTYDPSTYAGMMALQPGRDDGGAAGPEAEAAILRQTVALAATCKIIIKLKYAVTQDAIVSNTPFAGMFVTGAAGLVDANTFGIMRMGDASSGDALTMGVSIVAGAPTSLVQPAFVVPDYLMIVKTGNDYSAWAGDGIAWQALTDGAAPDNTQFTNANPLTRLSIFSYWNPAAAEVNLFNPITAFDFVRYFTNNSPLVNA